MVLPLGLLAGLSGIGRGAICVPVQFLPVNCRGAHIRQDPQGGRTPAYADRFFPATRRAARRGLTRPGNNLRFLLGALVVSLLHGRGRRSDIQTPQQGAVRDI